MAQTHQRIMLYSHDSYGLGHLRRSQTIAHALVARDPSLSVIIVSGSPVIGRFDFQHGVDFVRIPGVVKLVNGDYNSLHLNCSIKDLIAMRSEIILKTFQSFKPGLLIVDKEPLGLRGEMMPTLDEAKCLGVPAILGLRDILDEQEALVQEWNRKNVYPALEDLYREIWVYGPQEMGNPLAGVPLSSQVQQKTHFTGYLHREIQAMMQPPISLNKIALTDPYILIMAGGGGDGERLMQSMFELYANRGAELLPAIMLLGPFMPQHTKDDLLLRAATIPNLEIVYFSSQVESLLSGAKAIVSMGGYNSFCEILSFQKPALIYPRTIPRMEQYIRIKRAADLGVVQLLPDEDLDDYGVLFKSVKKLEAFVPVPHTLSLGGLDWIYDRVKNLLPIA